MDLNNETVREIALTVTGHLATAGVAYLLASIRLDRRLAKHLREMATPSVAAPIPAIASGIVPQLSDSRGKAVVDAIAAVRKSETEREGSGFVNLAQLRVTEESHSAQASHGRNRAEIIRLAKKMLEAGNSPERVADLLPLTETELQMARLGSANN